MLFLELYDEYCYEYLLFIRNSPGGFLDEINKNQMIRTNPAGCELFGELSGQGKNWGLRADHDYKTQ